MERRSVARGNLDHGRGGLGICCVACFAGTDPERSALRLLLGAMGIVDFGVGVVNAVVAVRYCFDDSTPKKILLQRSGSTILAGLCYSGLYAAQPPQHVTQPLLREALVRGDRHARSHA